VVIGQDGEVMFANSTFYSLLKLNPHSGISEQLERQGPTAFWDKLSRWSEHLLNGEQLDVDSELSIDNLVVSRWVEPAHQMLSLEDNSQVVVWILKDVTNQHRIHEQLITSQNHYRSTFEGAGVALAMVDLNELGELLHSGVVDSKESFSRWRDRNAWQFRSMIDGILITEVNESACRLLDTIDEMTAVKHLKKTVFHPDSSVWNSILALLLESNERTEPILSLSSVTGKAISVQVTVSRVQPTLSDSGNASSEKMLGSILLSLLDVSALKCAQEKAAEREQFWQRVVHSVPDVVYVNDFSSHSNVFVNHEIGLRLGYSHKEIEQMGNRYWQKLLHPEDKLLMKSELPRFRNLENGKVCETVLRLQHKNGKWHSYLFRDTPFTRDENNKVQRYIGIGRDITELLEARTKVDKHERYLEVLAENIRDLVWVMDPEFHFKYVSPSIEQVLGYKQEDLLHQGVRAFLAEDQFARIEQEIAEPLRAVMAGEINAESYRDETGEHIVEVMALHQDGHYVSLEVKIGLLWDEDHNFEGLLGSCRDVTKRRKSQAELKLAAEVFESSNEAILITDMDGDIVRMNRAFRVVTGYEDQDMLGKNLAFLCTEQQTEQFYHTLLDSVSRTGYWQGEVWHRKKNGEPFPAWVGVSAIKNDDDLVESYIVIFSDMSERKEAEERIHRLAYYDPLTDLANRSLFKEQLSLEMRRADDNHGAVALLYLDLDNFKPVNDTLGHEAGDILLKEVAQRLMSCVRSSDTVARMGGDEFTIILGGQASEAEARSFSEHVAGQVVSALQEPISIQQQDFRVTASVGIAVYPMHAKDASELLRHADHAMYRAKAGGRDLYQFYSAEYPVPENAGN
jgi:diguanylate cyclase (GGDEF)-like protein/PAS domain S-box-containing protein